MAYRFLKRFPRTVVQRNTEFKPHFNYLLVMDFEATCKYNEKIEPQEIIEFPCAAVSTENWKIVNIFHEYVKPRVHPQITPFCTKLTGIIQDMVENQPHFPEVFNNFCKWLEENKYFKDGNESAFVTCGDWDLKALLPSQCKLDNMEVPEQFKKWINIKHTFCDATDYYPKSLKDMLRYLDLPIVGQLHSGIDDVKNMINIIETINAKYNAKFKINCVSDVFKMYLKNSRFS